VPDLDNYTNQDKKDTYTYLDLKIKATPEGVNIKWYVQPKLLITGQTSGYQLIWTKSCPVEKSQKLIITF